MLTGMMMDERVLVLPLSPPRRLVPGARFRSLKRLADQLVWEQAWERVTSLLAEGWTLERVEVDFGRTLPLLPSQAADWLRAMCPDVERVDWTLSGRGRGETRVYLVKQDE